MPKLSTATKIRIQTLCESDKSIHYLSRKFGVTRKTIKRWAYRAPNQVTDKIRFGRPPKITPQLSRQIYCEMKQPNTGCHKSNGPLIVFFWH